MLEQSAKVHIYGLYTYRRIYYYDKPNIYISLQYQGQIQKISNKMWAFFCLHWPLFRILFCMFRWPVRLFFDSVSLLASFFVIAIEGSFVVLWPLFITGNIGHLWITILDTRVYNLAHYSSLWKTQVKFSLVTNWTVFHPSFHHRIIWQLLYNYSTNT